ncbi:Crp/Fnr family transcriptional regulator [Sphingobacterium shayense]|uniref:Crp/Fnr family transcriptional regulator n=1 Tax=Sphingobacterium shayense TaxID=626343 RepID=UPI0015545D2B|nr:Crp/Fnr family transcriptional regulator [Sphingobacterium shayense]NQD72309.1 Crp/Fnr family transcriptional regulator [Sphingobacterium shayense]
MHPLHSYINEYASTLISEEDFEFFLSHFIPKRIGKKRYLLEHGEVCKYFAFILKGTMRKYYIDEKGAEHVVDLYIENWWAGDRESFSMFTPTIYNIDACADCDVLLVSRENILKLCKGFPAFNEFILKLDERNHIATQKRITSTISLSAEKRYIDFATRHPYFLERFPQHIIASYLGITKDTLSRVRKK